uniref:ATP synthase complex subunit 8 n=1 Tax=Gekko chinensis TaxID=515997 RepID=A0A0U2C5P9_9SAUR|nr:ATP synthase F0 subunit 8 [Gekko chinensis]AKI30050.1 ATP synthase F0 subunit 8 [Gekko chinensis]
MPQLNPAPWLFMFIITWITMLSLLKLMIHLQDPKMPIKITKLYQLPTWAWTWL